MFSMIFRPSALLGRDSLQPFPGLGGKHPDLFIRGIAEAGVGSCLDRRCTTDPNGTKGIAPRGSEGLTTSNKKLLGAKGQSLNSTVG